MAGSTRFNWIRVGVAIVAAEVLPVLLLVLVVIIYGFIRRPESQTPEEFAPAAGMWVGPIGGFLATLMFSRWAARRASGRQFAHGVAVGVGTALLDFTLGILIGGGGIQPVFIFSNIGRVLAGVLGGWLGARRGDSPPSAPFKMF